MKEYVKLYEDYKTEPYFFTTYEETKDWLDSMELKNYTINDDLTVDVDGSVYLDNKSLWKIPVQFRKVHGYFYCNDNYLASIKGSPRFVKSGFYCYKNQLSNLKYSPKNEMQYFSCGYNKLTSLKGCPKKVYDFRCNYNKLKNLIDGPNLVGNIDLENNELTSLEGCPIVKYVNGLFVGYNKLTSFLFTDSFPETFHSNPCTKFYEELPPKTQADIKCLLELDPNPADTLRRLKIAKPEQYENIISKSKELRLLAGEEKEDLQKAYQTSVDVEGDFY